jgi:hypothetical protein
MTSFFEKLGKVLTKNIGYTVVLIVALIFFLYFAEGDLIAGLLTAISALVVYVCVMFLYEEYKKMSMPKKSSKKK